MVSFKRYSHEIDGKTVYEIVAANVTERYRLTKELEQKLEELKAVNKRLVAYGDNVVLLTKENENPYPRRYGQTLACNKTQTCRTA